MSRMDGGSVRVLHVDDEPDLVELSATYLERERADLTVVTETSAADALGRLDGAAIDCVVSDYDMPGMDGLEFLEAVRESHPELPFILFTGKGSEEIASEAITAGVTDYIQKEVGADQYTVLANRIERAVRATRAEDALEESERMLSTLIGNLPGMVYRCRNEPGWPMEFVSDGCRPLTGYDAERIESGSIDWGSEVIHPDDRGTMWETVQAALDERERFEVTYRIRTAEGETRWMWEQGQGIYEDGAVTTIEGFITDITDRKEAQQRRQQYETIVESMDDGAYILDENCQFEFVNTPFLGVSGRQESDVIGEKAGLFVSDSSRANYQTALDRLERGDASQIRTEVDVTPPDRDELTVHLRLTRLAEDGQFRGIVGIARDISERKARERELERYETIIQAVGDPVYTLDAEGNFTFMNDAIEPLTGYEPDTLEGKHVSTIVPDADAETARDLIETLLESDDRRNATFEMGLKTRDGDRIPSENHMALLPFGSDGKFRGTAGVVRDITERKQREERLAQFASVVSHDLRNPLNVIQGRLEFARKTGDSEHLDTMADAADRMERLIDDLLTLAQQGQTVGDTEPVDVERVAVDAWEQVETDASTLDVDGPIGTVSADRGWLRELFENLFRNAVEHGSTSPDSQARQDAVEHGSTGEADGPTVRVGPIDGEGEGEQAPSGIYVADDGRGIPPEERQRVFEHGYSESDEGTGFGLTIVENIVEAHGWEITLTDSDSGGIPASDASGESGDERGESAGTRFEITGLD
ncbi:PAS domain S-box protein [Halorientalis salina]|uniref:PAS domain S-box protein n=1 Tax=Halorientalis salina TaxID=2932266 RepID=UPI0010AC4D9E|nr:PAS domain S-box protein [Halorientalis salina]